MTDLAKLAAELGEGVLVTDPDILGSYRHDRAMDPAAGSPLAVVRPTKTEEVQAVLRWASAHRVPVVPRGAGTGLSGGATAVDGGIVLSTEKMRAITVDPVTRTAVAQPGLLNAEVKQSVAEHGLWYPPDPSSYEICSIGGNVATNAGGLCCVKYGVTTDYVLGLQVVLADGTAVRLGGPRLKDVAGLSLHHFSAAFKASTGMPPHRYQIDRRIRRAKELLLGTDRSIIAIALEVGFASHSHFTDQFRKWTNTTPSRFRMDRR